MSQKIDPLRALNDVRQEIRSLNMQIKSFVRSSEKVTVRNLDGTESQVDPIPELENKKHLYLQRFEQLNEGKSHQFTDEERIEDFLIMFFRDAERKEKDIEWLAKFYHPEASMTWIEGITQTLFEKRDNIIDSYVVSFLPLLNLILSGFIFNCETLFRRDVIKD